MIESLFKDSFILELSLKEVGERGTLEFQGKAGEGKRETA